MSVGDYAMKKKQNKKNKEIIYIFMIALIGVFLDQISKAFIRNVFNNNTCGIQCIKAPCTCLLELIETGGMYNGFKVVPGRGVELIQNFFYIINVKNTGAAWGMFTGNVLLLAIISIFVLILLYFFLKDEKNLRKLQISYYGLLYAGIIGNLIDRIFNGYVTDFLNFYIFNYDYPVFNIADIFIVVGILLMMIDVVRGGINEYNMRKRKYKNWSIFNRRIRY